MEMCNIIPYSACPNCGHQQFVVAESQLNLFLTGRHGDVIDQRNLNYHCDGMCCKCGRVYDMEATPNGYLPLTPLRKLLFERSSVYDLLERFDNSQKNNPMFKED